MSASMLNAQCYTPSIAMDFPYTDNQYDALNDALKRKDELFRGGADAAKRRLK